MTEIDVTAALEQMRGLISERDDLQARMNAAPADSGEFEDAVDDFTAAQDKLAARVPRLVAAVEAVLKAADSARARQQVYLPGSVTQPISWDLDPAKIREAIRAALAGKEAGGEPQVP